MLLTKRGISAPAKHPLRIAVEKHKARLAAELTRARLRRGCATLEHLRRQVKEKGAGQADPRQYEDVVNGNDGGVRHNLPQPRWVRVNTVKTTMEDQLNTTFAGFKPAETLNEVLSKTDLWTEPQLIHIDQHVPNLLALSPGTDLSKTQAYLNGSVILQDKASCFPAYLLDPDVQDCCMDACAAPGNKSTHLAAILREKGRELSRKRILIHATERDPKRASVLDAMLAKAGASDLVRVHRQDFLTFDPTKPPCSTISALLLDPSCSGSGIVSRDQNYQVTLPSIPAAPAPQTHPKRKRKRANLEPLLEVSTAVAQEETPVPADNSPEFLQTRLASLSAFQTRLLLHALHFPNARTITYSTCSIYADENEHVVIKALLHSRKESLGWRMLLRSEQAHGMQAWDVRGDIGACREALFETEFDALEIAEACIRCEKGTAEGTQGFFVAAFVRDVTMTIVPTEEIEEEEWEGFDND